MSEVHSKTYDPKQALPKTLGGERMLVGYSFP